MLPSTFFSILRTKLVQENSIRQLLNRNSAMRIAQVSLNWACLDVTTIRRSLSLPIIFLMDVKSIRVSSPLWLNFHLSIFFHNSTVHKWLSIPQLRLHRKRLNSNRQSVDTTSSLKTSKICAVGRESSTKSKVQSCLSTSMQMWCQIKQWIK